MKISDEIRELAGEADSIPCDELSALADRIDHKMVELPKSADGKIWTGREVCFWTGPANEDWHEFYGLHYADGRWCVEDSDFERYPAVSVWYERPDGLERIADELEACAMEWSDKDGSYGTVASSVNKSTLHTWATRIRKLAKEDK